MKVTKAKLKGMLKDFRASRRLMKEMKDANDAEQPQLLAFLKEVDPDNKGYIFSTEEPDGKNAAFRSGGENTAEEDRAEVWNMDAVLDLVNNDPKLKKSCTTRVISIEKFEAEVAAGNVPAAVAKGLKQPKPPSTEYINFQKPKPTSVK